LKLPAQVIVLSLCVAMTGCGRGAAKTATDSAAPPVLLIAPEDVITARSGTVSAGPLISGTIQPDRRADLRAEVSAIVLAVLKENGQPVRKGDLLVRPSSRHRKPNALRCRLTTRPSASSSA
jgi:membrane fusion protein (multidrug efflux system)